MPVCGDYTSFKGRFTALYVSGNRLHFKLPDSDWVLSENANSTLTRRKRGLRLFPLIAAESLLPQGVNMPPGIDPILEYGFTWADEEDFDFFLFVHNVVNSPTRRQDYMELKSPC